MIFENFVICDILVLEIVLFIICIVQCFQLRQYSFILILCNNVIVDDIDNLCVYVCDFYKLYADSQQIICMYTYSVCMERNYKILFKEIYGY